MPSEKKKLSFRYIKFLYVQEGMNVMNLHFAETKASITRMGNTISLPNFFPMKTGFIKVVRFDGNDKGCNILLRNEYGYQCLITAIKMPKAFVQMYLIRQRQSSIKTDTAKIFLCLIELNLERHGITPAFTMIGLTEHPPAIYVFNDRLEIISTGGLPHNMTKEDFFGGVSKPVNVALAKIFIKLGLIEQTEHGVTAITDKYGQEAFTFLDNFLRVTFPFNYKLNEYIKSDENSNGTDIDTDNGASKAQEKDSLSDEEKIILAIKNNPNITTAEMMQVIGKSRRTVTRINVNSSKIIRKGTSFDGHWEIKE